MSVLLPSAPSIRGAVPRLLDFGSMLTPPSGGAQQRLNRLGNRYGFTVRLPRMMSEPSGRVWAARLRRAVTQGAIYPFWQDIDIGAPGSPLVSGGGQLGSSIALKGFAPGYEVREGQFFSIIIGGRRYLYEAAADTTANGSGNLTLPLACMIRVPAANNAICEFAMPMIEGFLAGGAVDPELLLEPMVQFPEFTITEIE